MSKLVIYHKNCNDGFCAAWLMSLVWGRGDDVEYVAAQYGEEPPDVTGREVVVADFSYPRKVMLRMSEKAKSLLVFDHHKTAKDDCEDLTFCTFNLDKSGARLVYEYLLEEVVAAKSYFPDGYSWMVDYTEDRDLWRWKLPRSAEVNAAISSYSRDFPSWNSLACRSCVALADEGRGILRYQRQQVENAVREAGVERIGGHTVPCINATTLISETAGELAKDKPFAACWFQTANGDRVYSLRSDAEGLDVSEVAKEYGGGGHRNAAGFTVKRKDA